MTNDNFEKFGPHCAPLLKNVHTQELERGTPNEEFRDALSALEPQLLAPSLPLTNREMANCCLAGLWLAHNFLDESHTISQDIDTTSGSYWHGIMHRREPDYANAKYWFRRVGKHPIFGALAEGARRLASQKSQLDRSARFLTSQAEWDAFAFIDLVENVCGGQSSHRALCEQIAWTEWQLLFDNCYSRAFSG